MHWLGMLHAAGLCADDGGRGGDLALMWIAKAAAHGHVIAQAQMKALTQRALASAAPSSGSD